MKINQLLIKGTQYLQDKLIDKQSRALGTMDASHPATGISISKALNILEASERGDIVELGDLFEDMEERDPHLFAELAKRRLAVTDLDDYELQPPPDATPAEQKIFAAIEQIWDAMTDREDLLYQLSDGIGKGMACVELSWRQQADGLYVPARFDLRPLAWFALEGDHYDQIVLRKGTENEPLWDYGWIVHRATPRSGYSTRNALLRCLIIPYLLKNYSVQDWAEYNERHGMPIPIGKYHAGATQEQRSSLLSALGSLKHNGRLIVPRAMSVEFVQAGASNYETYQDYIGFLERAMSKAILGATLTAQADGVGTHALGKVHAEVREDIRKSDVRQLAATLSTQLIQVIARINFAGAEGLRLPMLVPDTVAGEDLKTYAESIPKLQQTGLQIPAWWLHDKLRIPEPQKGDEVLTPQLGGQAALASLSVEQDELDTTDRYADRLDGANNQAFTQLLSPVKEALNNARTLEEFRDGLAALRSEMDSNTLTEQVALALSAARLAGRFELEEESE